MKIHYSPYFNGHAFIDYPKHGNILFGECLDSTAGILNRLELICGIPRPEVDAELRSMAYLKALRLALDKDDPIFKSLSNDDPDQRRLKVSTELLNWRDTLILAGWDRQASLPGKLWSISHTEEYMRQKPSSDWTLVPRGEADRWLELSAMTDLLKAADLQILVHCPSSLLPPLILKVLKATEHADLLCEDLHELTVAPDHYELLQTKELYQAYEWLATQKPDPQRMVVCRDQQRLDNVLRHFSQPDAGPGAQVGSHQVTDDVRCQLDAPHSLVWLDCNGDYGLQYPYGFVSVTEARELYLMGLNIVPEQQMLTTIHAHLIALLSAVEGKVTLLSSRFDNGNALAQHPIMATLLQQYGPSAGVHGKAPLEVSYEDQLPHRQLQSQRFEPQLRYELGTDIRRDAVMSYTELDRLIQYPFQFAIERLAALWEPHEDKDLHTEQGELAHKVVELMVSDHHELRPAETADYLDKALQQKYYAMALPENRFELENLKHTIQDSLEVLQQIIHDRSLEIVASEYAIPERDQDGKVSGSVELQGFGQGKAFIDLLLRDKHDGDYVIFDFKYSRSNTTYEQKLQENLSIQFAFYEYIFNSHNPLGKGKVKAMGYYLFPRKTLYVPEGHMGNNYQQVDNIQIVPLSRTALPDLLEAMKQSYTFRMQQFASGIVEEGEKMPIRNLDYQVDGQTLVPIQEEKGNKKAPYVANHIVLKNQIR